MRIAWFSNSPKHSSGYATQTDLITRALVAAGHEVAILCSHMSRDPLHRDDCGRTIYPCGLSEHSQDTIGPYSEHFNADITVLFFDGWGLKPEMWHNHGPDYKLRPVLMFPVDHEPILRTIVRPARKAWANITYSRHGWEAARQAGIESIYIPHAVDTGEYYPMDRCEARAQVGVPVEPFIVGVVAANNDPAPTRKNWENIIEGFRLFHFGMPGIEDSAHPKSLLYIHTDMSGQYDIAGHLEDAGLGECVAFTDATLQRLGLIEPRHMNSLYNAFDCLLLPSRGEGFGLPLLEAQSAGTPVITGDWTATGELCFSGVLIGKGMARAQRLTDLDPATGRGTGAELYRWTAPADVIAESLKAMYDAPLPMRANLRVNARHGAVVDGVNQPGAYDYDISRVVAEYWLPTLAGFAERIAAEKMVD